MDNLHYFSKSQNIIFFPYFRLFFSIIKIYQAFIFIYNKKLENCFKHDFFGSSGPFHNINILGPILKKNY
jgi:hypothetical protein